MVCGVSPPAMRSSPEDPRLVTSARFLDGRLSSVLTDLDRAVDDNRGTNGSDWDASINRSREIVEWLRDPGETWDPDANTQGSVPGESQADWMLSELSKDGSVVAYLSVPRLTRQAGPPRATLLTSRRDLEHRSPSFIAAEVPYWRCSPGVSCRRWLCRFMGLDW